MLHKSNISSVQEVTGSISTALVEAKFSSLIDKGATGEVDKGDVWNIVLQGKVTIKR